MKENTTKDMDVYSKDSTVIERPESYNIGVKVGWTAPAKWWNWLFKNVTERLKDLFNTVTSIHNELKNAVGGTLDPKSDTQLKDRLEQMKKDLADMTATVSANLAALEATKAKPNGIASLDPDGRIPYSQLPESAMEFKGDWNAFTNTPALADGTGDLGDVYLVSVGGTVDLGSGDITFLDGDRVIYNQAGKWEKISGGSVKSVNKNTPDATGNVDVIVDSTHIADGAVTEAKIATGAIKTINTESIIGSGNIVIKSSPFYVIHNSEELQSFITGSILNKSSRNIYLVSGEYEKTTGTRAFSFSDIKGIVIAEPGVLFRSGISNYNGPGMYGVKMNIAATVSNKSSSNYGFLSCKNLYGCDCTININSTFQGTPVATGTLSAIAFNSCENLIGCNGTANAIGNAYCEATAMSFTSCNSLLYCKGGATASSGITGTAYSVNNCKKVAFSTFSSPGNKSYASNESNTDYLVKDTPAGGFNKI